MKKPGQLELQYKELFLKNPIPMWIYDLKTLRFLEVNNAAIKKYSYSEKEFLSMTIKDIRPPEDIPALLKNISKVTEGLDEAGIWRHIKKDGSMIYVEITSHTLNYSGKRAEVVVAHDVTKRLEAEEKLIESQNFLNMIVENSGDAIVTTDNQRRITLWSKGAEKLYGYKSGEVLGKEVDFIYPPELKKERIEWQKAILSGKAVKNIRTNILNTEGELLDINLTLSPMLDKEGRPIGTVGVSRDIRGAIEAEKKLKEKINELEKWQRLTVGREIRMVELKKEIKELKAILSEHGLDV